MPKFNFEDRIVAGIDRRSAMGGDLSDFQKPFRKAAEEAEQEVVEEGRVSAKEHEKDQAWVLEEQKRRDEGNKPEEKEYKEKVDATTALMRYFFKDPKEGEKGVTVIPTGNYDRLKSDIRFILKAKDNPLGVCVDSVLTDEAFDFVSKKRMKDIQEGKIESLATDKLKYIYEEDIAGELIPKIRLVLKRPEIKKMIEATAEVGDPKAGLTDKELEIKRDARLDIEKQLHLYIKRIDEVIAKTMVGKGVSQAEAAKLKIIKEKLEKFKECF